MTAILSMYDAFSESGPVLAVPQRNGLAVKHLVIARSTNVKLSFAVANLRFCCIFAAVSLAVHITIEEPFENLTRNNTRWRNAPAVRLNTTEFVTHRPKQP